MNLIKMLLGATLAVSLTGCFEGRKNTDQLCEKNPRLQCELFNMGDGQCRIPRTDMIWHRYEGLPTPSDAHKIEQYHLVAKYQQCLELASQIEPLDKSNIKELRFRSLVNAGKELDRIVSELEPSKTPQALYFLWSQLGDENAQRSFLQLEPTGALDTADMQYALATFYTGKDKLKTRDLLHRSLELSRDKDLNVEVIKSLAGVNQSLNNLKQAYVWALIAKDLGVPVASESELRRIYRFDNETESQLMTLKGSIEDAIDENQFNAALIPQGIEES